MKIQVEIQVNKNSIMFHNESDFDVFVLEKNKEQFILIKGGSTFIPNINNFETPEEVYKFISFRMSQATGEVTVRKPSEKELEKLELKNE